MAKVKMLDGKEYELKSLSSLDLYNIDELQKKNKELKDKAISDLKMTFTIYLYAFKKFNPELKDMKLDEFMEIFPLVGMEEKIEEISKITGLNFKAGVGKK